MSFDQEEFPGFQISGRKTLLVKPTKCEILSSDFREFTNSYDLEMTDLIPEAKMAKINYTLDGSIPTQQSALYSEPHSDADIR